MIGAIVGWSLFTFWVGVTVGAGLIWRYGKRIAPSVPRATVAEPAAPSPITVSELQGVADRLAQQYGSKFTGLNSSDRAAMVARTVASARRALGGRA